ncbi:hypothetical protein RRG08_022317 [Elysia crispata]|uniref:Uncharacterized protein n=1 Tax=Elysia crispata TaxID=231223 RepID=A0AAE1DLB1_9GAST|nr:hypothetical protein RRG08_022317 [Elysia crispata]
MESVEAVDKAKECLKIKEVIGQTQTDRKGLGSSTAKWWSKAEGKEKRDMVINEIRINEDSRRLRKQSSNLNRNNGPIGIMPCRNPSHRMRSGTWRHFGSAFSSDQCTIISSLVRWGKKQDHLSAMPKQADHRACLELLQNRPLTGAIHVEA